MSERGGSKRRGRRKQDGISLPTWFNGEPPGQQYVAIDLMCRCPRRLYRLGRTTAPGEATTPWCQGFKEDGVTVLPGGWAAEGSTKAHFACVNCGIDEQYRGDRVTRWLELLADEVGPGGQRVVELRL